jgi:hypothetical protein
MNIKKWFDTQQMILLIGLILLGTLGRYLFIEFGLQPFPNFEIIMVLTLIAVFLIRSPLAFLVPLFSMIFSDLLIGNPIFVGNQMNRIVLFTYSGFAILALISIFNRERFRTTLGHFNIKSFGFAAGLGIGFVLIYDTWTNIGWWYLMYPHTAKALLAVFSAGVPFMIYHLISGMVTFVALAVPIAIWTANKQSFALPQHITLRHKLPLLAVVFLLVGLSFTGTAMQVPQKTEVWLEHSDVTSVTIFIKGNGWTVEDHIVALSDDTAFKLLEKCCQRNHLKFEYTYYEQFDAVLIDTIQTSHNGDGGQYWQYYVNDDIPMIGSDKYSITNGDVLRWSFEVVPY